MGRNNLDYKLKDKRLTKNKKSAKLNKSIAFALAGMASISLGASMTEIPKEVKAQTQTEMNKPNSLKRFSKSKTSKEFKNSQENFSYRNFKSK